MILNKGLAGRASKFPRHSRAKNFQRDPFLFICTLISYREMWDRAGAPWKVKLRGSTPPPVVDSRSPSLSPDDENRCNGSVIAQRRV